MIAAVAAPPAVTKHFAASLVWLHAQPLARNRRYLLKHASHTVPAWVRVVRHRVDIETLEQRDADSLDLNGIGEVEIETDRAILADRYSESRATGSFILIDQATNATVGAGMIRDMLAEGLHREDSPRIVLAGCELAAELEQRLLGLGYPVVRTRVRDHGVWRALHEAGVIVLVESEQTVEVVSKEFNADPVADPSVDGLLAALDISTGKEGA
jgi:hypothetical protein